MARTTTAGAPVGDTVVSFLRGAVERHGPRDALLFKPAFRYLRWSYSRLWKSPARSPPCFNAEAWSRETR